MAIKRVGRDVAIAFGALATVVGLSTLHCGQDTYSLDARHLSCKTAYTLLPAISWMQGSRTPFGHVAYQTYGVILANEGDRDGAIKAFRRALTETEPPTGRTFWGQDVGWKFSAARRNLETAIKGQSSAARSAWARAK